LVGRRRGRRSGNIDGHDHAAQGCPSRSV
jgi:hypothetical protein